MAIPLENLFGHPAKRVPTVSPDGMSLAWLAPSEDCVMNIWLQTIAEHNDAVIDEARRQG